MAVSAYEVIRTETVGTAVASVTFSSIASTYTDLVLVCYARTTRAATSDNIIVRFNSDSTAIYSATALFADTGVGSARSSGDTSCFWAYIPAASQNGNTYGASIMNIMNYSNTTTYKTAISRSNNTNAQIETTANLYRSTSAISTLTISSGTANNIAAGSTFTLYGIKAA